MPIKSIFNIKVAKSAEILEILNTSFKPTLVQKFPRIESIHCTVSPHSFIWSEILTLRKRDIKTFDIN
jgi:hypothetical protein